MIRGFQELAGLHYIGLHQAVVGQVEDCHA
jgi:hypothetical protein